MRCVFMKKNLEKKIIDEAKKEEEFSIEVGEDSTKYGEFISSYFAWVPLPKQKEKAEKLQNMTKKGENKK